MHLKRNVIRRKLQPLIRYQCWRGPSHVPRAVLTLYRYFVTNYSSQKDFLWREGYFIIAHPLCYRRTFLEENRHLEIMPVILSAAKDDRHDLQMHRHDWPSRLSLRRGPLIGIQ